MKRFFALALALVVGLFAASYDANAGQYQSVTITESYGSAGMAVTNYGSTGSAQHHRRQPVRNVIRAGRKVARGTVRVAAAPIRAVGSCR